MTPDETNAAPPLAPGNHKATAKAVREMLRARGFTLYRVATLVRARYPRQAAFHIRRNFYFQLRSGLSPTFQQVLALSELTGSPLRDWLAVFGFSLGDIPHMQAVLTRPRTLLIENALVDPQTLIPFLRYRWPGTAFPATAPLSQLLERSGSYPAVFFLARARERFPLREDWDRRHTRVSGTRSRKYRTGRSAARKFLFTRSTRPTLAPSLPCRAWTRTQLRTASCQCAQSCGICHIQPITRERRIPPRNPSTNSGSRGSRAALSPRFG